jgi:monoamine oxidase
VTIAIIGAGLSGLYAAWRLHQAGQSVQVFEARDRIGGRILTVPSDDLGGAFDLGPTWYWPDHQHRLPKLLDVLKLRSFEQHTQGGMIFEPLDGPPQMMAPPAMGPPSFRIAGGIGAMTSALYNRLPPDTVKLNSPVNLISGTTSGVTISENGTEISASHVLVSVPPRLFSSSITTEPALPESLLSSLNKTPTWMAAHAKLVAVYDQPFWRDNGLSGQAFSYRGPMMEIHDASPSSEGPYGLFGFVGIDAARRRNNADTVKQMGIEQLTRLFGAEASTPTNVLYKDWSEDAYTATPADEDAPSSHPHYASPELPDPWQRMMAFIGTEAAAVNGGYLEGCLEAVDTAIKSLLTP